MKKMLINFLKYNPSYKKYSGTYMVLFFFAIIAYPLWKLISINMTFPYVEPQHARLLSPIVGLFLFTLMKFKKKFAKRIELLALILTITMMYEQVGILLYDSFFSLESSQQIYQQFFTGTLLMTTVSFFIWKSKKYLIANTVYLTTLYTYLFTSFYINNPTLFNKYVVALDISHIFITLLFCYLLNYKAIDKEVKLEQENKALSRKSLETAKLASLGEMAGGIAHEINNPLQVISFSLEMLEAEDIKNREPIDNMRVTLDRVSNIVKSLMFLARKDEITIQKYDIKNLVQESLFFFEEKCRKNKILLHKDLNSVVLNINPTKISQVIVNLLNNAHDAVMMADKSERTIKISVTEDDNYGYLTIYDSGVPIDDKIAEKIFTPFFTTKPIGKGTGIGLSLSKSIVESHGGKLSFDKNPKQFKVKIPKKN